MERPGTLPHAYEDYQRDIKRFRLKKDGDRASLPRVSSLPVDVGGSSGRRSSQLTHLGGFRREFMHRKKSQDMLNDPLSTEGTSGPSENPSHTQTFRQNSDGLAAQIEDQMQAMAFFIGEMGSEDDGTLSPDLRARLLSDLQDGVPETGRAQRVQQGMSVPKACLSTFKAFIATGILFMPQALTNAGWAWAVILMSISCGISTTGILLLGQCHHQCFVSYPMMGQKAFGAYGYMLIAGQVAFSQFGFVSSYFIFTSATVQHIFESNGMEAPPLWALMLCLATLLTPLGWIRRIGKMKVVNIVGDVIILLAIVCVGAAACAQIYQHGVAPGVVAWAPPQKVFIFAGTAVYAFEGIALVIPIREGMAQPELFPYMLVGMMLLFMVILTGFGILGYLAWGTAVQTIVLHELSGPAGCFLQALYIFAVVCTFPIAIFPTFTICEATIFRHMEASTRRKWQKNLFRTMVTFLLGAVAYSMAAELSIFISMLGSFCSIPLAIIFPGVLHMKLVPGSMILDWCLVITGSCLIPLTLYVDIQSWGSS